MPDITPLIQYQFQPSKAKLNEALRQAMREAILTSPDGLWYLLTEVLMHPQIECDGRTTSEMDATPKNPVGCCWKKQFFYAPLHKEWCRWAQDETIKRKGLLAPRTFLKSTVVSLGKAAHSIILRPNVRLLIISQREKNATNFLGALKDAFQYNERMRWTFPEYCMEPKKQFGNQQEFTVPNRTDITLAAPTAYSVHLAASMASQHYDKVIMDDPISEDDVSTEEQAAKARRNYNKIVPLLEPWGEMLMVGTRYAYFDLFSTLLPPELGGTAVKTPYSWIVRFAFEKPGLPITQDNAEEHFQEGESIFPTQRSRAYLMNTLEECRSDPAQGETFWWNQYMNTCRAPGQAPFQDAWFQQIKPESVPPLFGKVITSDTALKDDAKHTGGDYTVIGPGGFDAAGRLYIYPDCFRSNRMQSKEYVDITVMLAKLYNISTVAKQKVSEDTMGTQLQSAFQAIPLPLVYKPITVAGMGKKQIRLKDALQGPMARSEVYFVMRKNKDGTYADHPLFAQAKKELINLGQYPVDDTADFMANFFHPEVRVKAQNVRGMGSWRVPHGPQIQIGNNQAALHKEWLAKRERGAGWPQ